MKTKINLTMIICTIIIGAIAYYGIKTIEKYNSYISTNGVSTRIVESDLAQLQITISNETNTIKDIQNKRQIDKKDVMEFLKKNGITDDNITHTDCSIEDMLRWTDNTKDKKKYKISDIIYIKSNDVYMVKKIAGMISSEFIEKGIIIDTNVKYLYKDLDTLRIEMIEEATEDSRNRADHISKVSKMKLIGLRNLHTGKFSIAAEDSSATNDSVYDEGENSINKRVRVVVQGTFNIK